MTAIKIGALLKADTPVTMSGADPGRLADEILWIGGNRPADRGR
jgi:hypothetical protein